MSLLYHLNVSLHVLAAILWLGGMFFFALVGAPVLRAVESPQLRATLFRDLGQKFRAIGWICIVVLLVTGVLNLKFRGMLGPMLFTSTFWKTQYGHILACKLIAVTSMLIVQGVHDFYLGPASTRAAVGTPEAIQLRRRAALNARVNAVLGIIVVIVAVYLARP